MTLCCRYGLKVRNILYHTGDFFFLTYATGPTQLGPPTSVNTSIIQLFCGMWLVNEIFRNIHKTLPFIFNIHTKQLLLFFCRRVANCSSFAHSRSALFRYSIWCHKRAQQRQLSWMISGIWPWITSAPVGTVTKATILSPTSLSYRSTHPLAAELRLLAMSSLIECSVSLSTRK